jgi:ankyrin repeat protein
VALHLTIVKDLGSFCRTSRRFYNLFNTELYRLALSAPPDIPDEIVAAVIKQHCNFASLLHLLNNGLPADYKLDDAVEVLRLLVACDWQEVDALRLARLLIDRGADIEAKDKRGLTALHIAVHQGNRPFATFLLSSDADLNAADNGKSTLPHYTLRSILYVVVYTIPMLDLHISHDADIDACDEKGNIQLLLVHRLNWRVIMPTLLAHGAASGARNNDRVTPLHLLTIHCHESTYYGLAKIVACPWGQCLPDG